MNYLRICLLLCILTLAATKLKASSFEVSSAYHLNFGANKITLEGAYQFDNPLKLTAGITYNLSTLTDKYIAAEYPGALLGLLYYTTEAGKNLHSFVGVLNTFDHQKALINQAGENENIYLMKHQLKYGLRYYFFDQFAATNFMAYGLQYELSKSGRIPVSAFTIGFKLTYQL